MPTPGKRRTAAPTAPRAYSSQEASRVLAPRRYRSASVSTIIGRPRWLRARRGPDGWRAATPRRGAASSACSLRLAEVEVDEGGQRGRSGRSQEGKRRRGLGWGGAGGDRRPGQDGQDDGEGVVAQCSPVAVAGVEGGRLTRPITEHVR